jgi:membrane-bound inhibitor of C-type lysozyme
MFSAASFLRGLGTLCLATLALGTAQAQTSPTDKPATEAAAVQQPSLVFSSQAVRYRCDGGAETELAYLNLSNGTAFAALHHDGRTLMLQGRRATTGVRFVALDPQHHLRWYTQGMKGELSTLDANGQEQVLMSNCFAQPANPR